MRPVHFPDTQPPDNRVHPAQVWGEPFVMSKIFAGFITFQTYFGTVPLLATTASFEILPNTPVLLLLLLTLRTAAADNTYCSC
jgi:hypothetical protein